MENKEKALTVGVFPTCVSTVACPALVRSTLSLLSAAGLEADSVALYSCCGQPAYSAGRVREARRVAKGALAALWAWSGPIVTPSGSCAAMIRKVWPKLFRKEPYKQRAIAVAGKVFELTEFLEPLKIPFLKVAPTPMTVTYHDSCHGLRELGLGRQARALLSRAGYQVVECDSKEMCCGFGGVFSQMLPEVAIRIGLDKAESLMRAAPLASGGDAPCLLHLSASLRSFSGSESETARDERQALDITSLRTQGSEMSFRHIAELLAERLDVDSVPAVKQVK